MGRELGSTDEEILNALLAIGQAISHEREIALHRRIGSNRVMRFRIESVINGITASGTEMLVMFHDWRAAAVGEDEVVARNQDTKWIAAVCLDSRQSRRGIDIPKCHARALGAAT